MIWYVLMGFFAAFGVLCAGWILFGLYLPGTVRCTVVARCPKGKEIAMIRRFCRFWDLGLTRATLVVLDSCLSQSQQMLICKQYPMIRFYSRGRGTADRERGRVPNEQRTGDSPGNHRSGGVSEL